MSDTHPQRHSRAGRERIHERAPDPGEAADRSLEPKAPGEPLLERDEPGPAEDRSAHHRLNTPVGEPDDGADSDPYRAPTADDEDDRASGTRGAGQGAEDS